MNDLECPILSYYMIYYEKFRKVIQRTEEEALTRVWSSYMHPVEKKFPFEKEWAQ